MYIDVFGKLEVSTFGLQEGITRVVSGLGVYTSPGTPLLGLTTVFLPLCEILINQYKPLFLREGLRSSFAKTSIYLIDVN